MKVPYVAADHALAGIAAPAAHRSALMQTRDAIQGTYG
jgi:hypothetical protein